MGTSPPLFAPPINTSSTQPGAAQRASQDAHSATPHRRGLALSVVPSRGSGQRAGQVTSGRDSRGPAAYGDRPRPELMAVHELELDALAQTGEQRRTVSGKYRLHKELVLVDQS